MNAIISSWGGRVPLRKSRGGFEDLVRALGFSELAFEALVLLLQILSGRRLGDLVAVAVAPHPQRLFTDSDLRGDGSDGVRARPSLSGLAFQDHPHGALTQLGGVLLGHVPILLQLDRNETQGASMYSATAISKSSRDVNGPLFRISSALNSELNASARALS